LVDIILEFLRENPGRSITNKIVRELSGEDDVNKIKTAFQKLRKRGDIVPVDENASPFDFKYVLTPSASQGKQPAHTEPFVTDDAE
jgi:ATP-dependent DNA helicase RecG